MDSLRTWQTHLAALLIIPCLLMAALSLQPRSAEATAMVTYEVKSIELNDQDIIFHGVFHNNTNFYQRVAACTLKYMLNDNDGYPMITGIANVDNLSVTVGKDPVPYDFTITDDTARYYTTTDIYGWKVEPEITLQNTN